MLNTTRLLLLTLLLSLAVDPALAQDRTRTSREVDTFTAVSFSVPGTLHLRQGETQSVEIEAQEKALARLETTVENGTLKIRAKDDDSSFFDRFFGSDHDMDEIEAYVTAPSLDGVDLAGSGKIVGDAPIKGDTFSLNSAGSGDIDLEVAMTDLEVSIAGSGSVRLQGTTSRIGIRVAGSGTVEAVDLTADTAEVEIAGSGNTQLHVTNQMSVGMMGSGDVTYRGTPSIETNILGSGEVRSIEK